MTDDKAQQLVDRNRLFLELPQLTISDSVKTLAIKSVFGPAAHRIPVSGTKSMTGHLLGATGAIEAAMCVMVIKRGIIPPTINLEGACNKRRQHAACLYWWVTCA